MGSGDGQWEQTADAVAAFRRSRGRWPVDTAKSADPEERRLAAWLIDRRIHEGAGVGWADPDRYGYLDRVAPGWQEGDQGEKWRAVADDLGAFRKASGRWPVPTYTADPLERRLGAWLIQQRRRAGRLRVARRAYLDRVAPGWDWRGLLGSARTS